MELSVNKIYLLLNDSLNLDWNQTKHESIDSNRPVSLADNETR